MPLNKNKNAKQVRVRERGRVNRSNFRIFFFCCLSLKRGFKWLNVWATTPTIFIFPLTMITLKIISSKSRKTQEHVGSSRPGRRVVGSVSQSRVKLSGTSISNGQSKDVERTQSFAYSRLNQWDRGCQHATSSLANTSVDAENLPSIT